MNLYDLTLTRALELLKNKELSAVELTQAHLDRSEGLQKLNAYITETPDRALADAKESDKRYADGTARVLEGIPIAHKDVFCTKGIPTTAASKILHNFIPPYESTVSQKLKDAGTTMLGKLNLDEFAMGSSCKTSAYGPAINPYKRDGDKTDLTPGGSSGGSVSAVSAGLIMGATATDTAGSIRLPASFCGIVGVKPTYGFASRYGCIPLASSMDHPGIIARTVKDSALLLKEIGGYDPKDSTSTPHKIPDFVANMTPSVKGLKVGLIKEADIKGLSPEIRDLLRTRAKELEAQGAEIIEISMPHIDYALAVYYVLCPAEASSNLARYDGVRYGHRTKDPKDLQELYVKSRAEGFGEEVKRRILVGTFVLSSSAYDAYFLKAAKVRQLIANDYKAAFEKVDVLLTPTTASPAFGLSEEMTPLEMYACDIFTVGANLAGVPAISVPAGFSSTGLPLGLHLQTNLFEEQKMFNVATVLESISNGTKKPSEII
ncbi:MAG: Asp-tRNA(Asn)/Glu-tRNA(Gln) amidotransferase subunit GatA [Alphaproteobacteria bacterium]|nr:Asp-tRNA(Asn)/Glu-tRNA(Gln) amidotransferase subunit GatA [Alphaproteobacteria bacterium]MBN2780281.1 Asp-tRNA(Asn)/Glu-tRNA(Gln) amidotransferase subunit GatA [Alphaproteobacteria bacterium]